MDPNQKAWPVSWNCETNLLRTNSKTNHPSLRVKLKHQRCDGDVLYTAAQAKQWQHESTSNWRDLCHRSALRSEETLITICYYRSQLQLPPPDMKDLIPKTPSAPLSETKRGLVVTVERGQMIKSSRMSPLCICGGSSTFYCDKVLNQTLNMAALWTLPLKTQSQGIGNCVFGKNVYFEAASKAVRMRICWWRWKSSAHRVQNDRALVEIHVHSIWPSKSAYLVNNNYARHVCLTDVKVNLWGCRWFQNHTSCRISWAFFKAQTAAEIKTLTKSLWAGPKCAYHASKHTEVTLQQFVIIQGRLTDVFK